MKKKIITIPTALVNVYQEEDRVRVDVFKGYLPKQAKPDFKFWVQKSSLDKFSLVPKSIIDARMLHDFSVKIEHYSYCNVIDRTTYTESGTLSKSTN